jgi:hypothetical protein
MVFGAIKDKSIIYSKLQQLDDIEQVPASNAQGWRNIYKASKWRRSLKVGGYFLSTILLSLILLFSLLLINNSTSDTPLIQTCGTTASEAKARGCQFDLLSYTWWPEHCIEKETAEEFKSWVNRADRTFGAFPFFANRNGTGHIPTADALSERVGIPTYTTQQEHLGHCVFYLRRIERMKPTATAHESTSLDSHVFHCTHELLQRLKGENPLDVGRLNAIFTVSLKSC